MTNPGHTTGLGAQSNLAAAGSPRLDDGLGPGTRVCVDVGASYVRVALADATRVERLVESRISDLPARGRGDIVAAIIDQIEDVLVSPPAPWKGLLPPIGVGVPAIVFEDGSLRVGLSSGIPAGSEAKDRLAERFGVEVVVDNDASMAALGESLYGAGQGERTLALLTLGTNIGMGVVVEGQVYRGAHGAAGEVGTVPVRLDGSDDRRRLVLASRKEHPQGAYPPEGYAWLEELYGGQALSNAWWARTGARAEQVAGAGVRVLQLAAAGDPVAEELVGEAVEGWALAIATTCGILDPAIVLIGGGIVDDLEPYLGRLRVGVDALLAGRPPRIEMATLGAAAGLIGAAASARLAPSRSRRAAHVELGPAREIRAEPARRKER